MRRVVLWLAVAAALGVTAFLVFGLLGDEESDSADPGADHAGVRTDEAEDPHLRGTGLVDDLLRPASSPFEIVGRVLDADGEPVVGCRVGAKRPDVRARNPRDPSTWTTASTNAWGRYWGISFEGVDRPMDRGFRADRTTETDRDGRYRIAVTEVGSHTVRALVEAPLVGSTATAWVRQDMPRASASLTVLEGARLDARVVDAGEAGVGAVVWGRIRTKGNGTWSVDPTETDPTTGSFVYPALPAGEASFTVVIPGRLIVRGHDVTLPHEGVWTIRLGSGSGSVTGTIQDGGGAPVADAQILVGVGPSESRTVARGASGSDGTYRVEGLPAGEVTSVTVERDGFGPYAETLPLARWAGTTVAEGGSTTLDVTLLAGATVEGVVREVGSGRPLSGVEVFLLPRSGNRGEPAVPNTRTDADGRYTLDGAKPGAHVLVARSPRHYLPPMATPQPRSFTMDMYGNPVTPPPPAELMLVIAKTDTVLRRDIQLAKGLTLRGRVVGPDGEAVGGAEVTAPQFGLGQVAWRWGVSWPGWNMPLAVTGADGRFAVHELPPVEALTLSASKRPLAAVEPVTVRVAEGAPAEEVVIRLAPGIVIEGRVLDPDGNGVQAWINAWSTSGNGHAYSSTDPDGSFRLEDLSAGGVRLMTSSRGFAPLTTTLEEIPAGETKSGVEIRLRSGVRVSGVLVDQHGRPVPGHGLSLQRPNTGMGLEVQTDESGYFETEHAPQGTLRVTHTVMENGTGASRNLGKPFESPKEGLRLTMHVPERTVVAGSVVGPDGSAVPLCRVFISPVVDGHVARRRSNHYGWSDPSEVVNGEFRREVKGEPPFEVRVATPRDRTGQPLNLAEASVRVLDPAAGPVEIRLEEGLEVRGRVVDGEGTGIADVNVQLGTTLDATDSDGAFRIGGLSDAKVALQVTPPPGWVKPESRQVDVGDEEVIVVLARAAAIAGVVLDADGSKVQGYARIQATWKSSGDVKGGTAFGNARNGTFRVEGIPQGVTIHLEVRVYGGQAASAPIELDVEAGTLDIEVRAAGGPGLAGVVVDEAGRPMAAAQLSIRRVEDGQSVWVQATEDGTFRATGLEPGTWVVLLTRPGERTATDAVSVTVPTEDARLVFGEPRTIKGRLVGKADHSSFSLVAWPEDLPGTQIGERPLVKADGTFEVKGLGRGPVVLASGIRKDDLYVLSAPIEPGATGVELPVRTGERITGRVLGADGKPRVRVFVYVRGERYQAMSWSNEAGEFDIRGLPPGTYRLWVHGRTAGSRGPEVQVASGATNVELRAP